MIITGDPTQTDLPPGQKSGLSEAISLLAGLEGIGYVTFQEGDVVRHDLVRRIVGAYEASARRAHDLAAGQVHEATIARPGRERAGPR